MGQLLKIFSPVFNVISSLMGGDDDEPIAPAAPAPVAAIPAPVAPKDDSKEVLASQEAERRRIGAMQGKSSTLATAGGWKGLGETDEEDQFGIAKKKLLG